jgi:uracil phosphoribosyltransferase
MNAMFHEVRHPLIQNELARLRQKDCSAAEFRTSVRRIAALMTPTLCAGLETVPRDVETPLETVQGHVLARPIVLVPILRAGLGFLDGFLDMIPQASVAHIGLKRHEATLKPHTYYSNLPAGIGGSDVILLDPMLATGGSAVEAVRQLRAAGVKSILFACLVAAPEGVTVFSQACPEVPVYAAALDRCLNEHGYILPGLGDAGDRLFGT